MSQSDKEVQVTKPWSPDVIQQSLKQGKVNNSSQDILIYGPGRNVSKFAKAYRLLLQPQLLHGILQYN